MIIQGTNKPIKIEINASVIPHKLSVMLFSENGKNHRRLAHWTESNVMMTKENGVVKIECPQTEHQTMRYTAGDCMIECKWYDGDVVNYINKYNDKIVRWYDNTVLSGD